MLFKLRSCISIYWLPLFITLSRRRRKVWRYNSDIILKFSIPCHKCACKSVCVSSVRFSFLGDHSYLCLLILENEPKSTWLLACLHGRWTLTCEWTRHLSSVISTLPFMQCASNLRVIWNHVCLWRVLGAFHSIVLWEGPLLLSSGLSIIK